MRWAEWLIHAGSLCLLLAATETLHGIFRTVVLVPRVGKARAQQVSIVTGSLLALGLCVWRVPLMGLDQPAEWLALGGVLSLFMAAFDAGLSLTVMRRSWRKTLDDFRPSTGNYLLYGLIWLVFCPWVAVILRRSWMG